MKKRTAALLVGLAVIVLLAFSGFGRAKTYSTVGEEQRRELGALPDHANVRAEPDLVVERFAVISAPPEAIYDVLVSAEKWPDWDHGISRVSVPARRPLEVGDRFTKVESGMTVEAEVIDAERGALLRWRGHVPGKIVCVHSFQLVPLDAERTLVVDRDEFSQGYLRLFGWVTDLGLGKRFDRTLEGLKAAPESPPQS